MHEEIFTSTQDLPASRTQVFPFFADPGNLEHLTPPWLRFRILTPAPLPSGEGAVFEYQLRVRGLPLHWRTLIESFVPGERFVDRQVSGPYALWHHTHIFQDLPNGGTRIIDRIRYRAGWGILGRLVTVLWIRRDIAAIFAYRQSVLAELFGADRKTA